MDDFKEIINPDGTFVENWPGLVSEDFKEDKTLQNIKDLPGMAKMLVSAQKMVGADKIVIPGEHATEEDWGNVFNKLGRPETPDGYKLVKPENIPEGLPYNEEGVTAFKTVAHKLGLLPEQTKALFEWYNSSVIDGFTQAQNTHKETLDNAVAALKKDWGAAYDQKMKTALDAVRAFADEDAYAALEEGLGNDPRLVKVFAKIGESISEDKLKGGNQAHTPKEAQSEINRILADKKHPYHNKKDPGHKAAVGQMEQLYAEVYPEDKK